MSTSTSLLWNNLTLIGSTMGFQWKGLNNGLKLLREKGRQQFKHYLLIIQGSADIVSVEPNKPVGPDNNEHKPAIKDKNV